MLKAQLAEKDRQLQEVEQLAREMPPAARAGHVPAAPQEHEPSGEEAAHVKLCTVRRHNKQLQEELNPALE